MGCISGGPEYDTDLSQNLIASFIDEALPT